MEPCLTSVEERESVLKAMKVVVTSPTSSCMLAVGFAPWLSCHKHACPQESWIFWKEVKDRYQDPGHTLLHPGTIMLNLLQPNYSAKPCKLAWFD